ncbi:hypothetical protein [Nesterenkonia sandarakina]|uniref:Uncharacterized protein n=1 Tax=Nesterenkonia sandarakina TaxID=272918 RepID=A0A2T0YIW0_9MICC|nr:hypothetical protein [Nesterenkonia sandarakina]PRZ15144.1 hypothetical protein BCL67_10965 [Nesterenkonia sandarakina]
MTEQNTPTDADETTEDTEVPAAPTPDVDTFDLAQWLATGETGRSSETVTIYRDPSLEAEVKQLRADVAKHNAANTGEPDPDATFGDEDTASELERRQADLNVRIRAAKADVVITALSDGEVEEIAASFKKRYVSEKRNWNETVKGTCMVLAQAATVNGQRLTADQWQKLSEGPLAGGQWAKIKQAWLAAQHKTPRVDAPFS